jgi:hypothetical protein
MGEKPLEVLKAGLAQLKKQIKARKDTLSLHVYSTRIAFLKMMNTG